MSMSGGDAGSKRARAEEAEAEALARLTTVPLKIAGVLFGLTKGGAKGVAREQMLAPLEKIGCLNPNNATQKNRVQNYPNASWFLHQGQGADVRMGLSNEGVVAIHELFTNDEDEVDQEGLDALTRAIEHATASAPAAAPEGATPISLRKQARKATATPTSAAAGTGVGGGPPATATAASAAVEEVEVEARPDDEEAEEEVPETEEEEEDHEDDENTSIKKLQQRLDLLAQRFDERIQKDSLAAAYGELAAEFLKTQGRVPTSREGDKLLREARDEMYAAVEMGDGKVKHAELVEMFRKLQEASKLAGEVLDLEKRMSTAK